MNRVTEAYGAISQRYIELFDDIAAVDADDLALIERHLGVLTGPVIDVGCGPGRLTAHLHGLGADVQGIDLTPEFVEQARHHHPDVPFHLGSMDQLAFGDASAAGILSWYSTIHTPPEQLDLVLAELRRVLRPGGRLVVGFFVGDTIDAFPHKVTTAYRWPINALSEHLENAGFGEIERLHHPAVPDREIRAHASIAAVAR